MNARATVLAIAFALGAVAGCAPDGERAGGAPRTLVWGINSQPDYLNPVLVGSSFGRQLCDLMFLRLSEQGPPPEHEFEPLLAESWVLSEDRRTITFRLRRDVRWHDGEPTTARDVKFTFDLLANPEVPYTQRGRIRQVSSCEVVDEWTVRFRFSASAWEPLYATAFHVVPEHLLAGVPTEEIDSAEFNRNPVGNGRWRFREWIRESRLVLEADTQSPFGRPAFDRVVFRFIPEDITLRTELLTGGVDVFHRYPHRFYLEDRTNEELEFLRIPDGSYVYIGWNLRNPLFADARVREALTLATDRQAVIDAFRAGFGRIVDAPVFAEHPDFNPNLEPTPHDPERAAALLDEAGWTQRDRDGFRTRDGRRFEFTYTLIANNEISEEVATMTQEAFGRLGIAVHTEFIEWTVFLEKIAAKDFDALILSRGNDLVLDPEDVYHSRSVEGRYNSISFADPTVDSLIDLAKSLPDRSQRRKVWWRYQEVMQELHAITPLYTGMALYPVRRDKVEHAVMDVRGPLVLLHEWIPRGSRP